MNLTRRVSAALLVAAAVILGTGFTASAQANLDATQLPQHAAPCLQRRCVAASMNYRYTASLDAFWPG